MNHGARRSALEAVAVVETASIARGFVALDALVKKAAVTVARAAPVSPGKFVLIFGGDVEATRESHQAALEAAGSGLVDELFLPGAHPSLLPAIDAAVAHAPGEAIGIVEMSTVAAAVLAADAALKAVDVAVLRMHLAVGVGGKGWFTLAGALADVEAALGAVKAAAREDRVVAIELIAQPHGEIRGFLA
ncbi:MAG: BMC domain-containing protein [Deltaproteobacteria bacterium]|nr:BMC domain-containing protein [Deltaproteobacteria bacterium]